jgi:hypothetical protein
VNADGGTLRRRRAHSITANEAPAWVAVDLVDDEEIGAGDAGAALAEGSSPASMPRYLKTATRVTFAVSVNG